MIISRSHLIFMPEIICGKEIIEAQSVRPLGYVRIFRIIMISKLSSIHMPFSDISRFIAIFIQHLSQCMVVRWIDTDLIDYHTGTGGIFPGQQRRPVWRTYRMP